MPALKTSFHLISIDQIKFHHMKIYPYWPYSTSKNDPKFSDTQNICCNHSKVWTMWLYHRLMSPNDADGMANSVDPDQTAHQTAPLGAVWSGSALFAQACLSENLRSLRYKIMRKQYNLSHVKRKTVFGVFNQVRRKLAWSTTETS